MKLVLKALPLAFAAMAALPSFGLAANGDNNNDNNNNNNASTVSSSSPAGQMAIAPERHGWPGHHRREWCRRHPWRCY